MEPLLAQTVKSLPAVWETWVRSLGWEDPELGRPPGEGNGNPLQYSCLEHPVDGGVQGVAKSRTQLNDLTHQAFASGVPALVRTHSCMFTDYVSTVDRSQGLWQQIARTPRPILNDGK